MDALGSAPASLRNEAVQRFLDEASSGETTSHEGIGLGMDVMLTAPNVVGHALTWEGGVVHLALFARSQDPNGGLADAGAIESPLQRRRYIY